MPKLFEMIVSEYLYFNVKSALNAQQHGFVRNRSTTTNLLSLSKSIHKAFESKCQVDVVFTDFSKAFDSVNLDIILKKIENFGLSPNFVALLSSYLHDRKQVVQVNGVISGTVIDACSGVPQGSHLGPILFNMFINDIVNLFQFSDALLYADDLKLLKIIGSLRDCIELQHDINRLYEWSTTNMLLLNINRCKVMTFARRRNPLYHSYVIGDLNLERVFSFKDLGVTLDEKFDFHIHIDSIISRSNAMLGFINRVTKEFRNQATLRNLYCSLVRSILEYASILWNPAYQIHIDRIEKVQKRFILSFLYKINFPFDMSLPFWQRLQQLPSYHQRCEIVNLETLYDRRKMASCMFVGNLLAGSIDCPDLLGEININVPSKPVRDFQFIYLPTFKSSYSFNAPFPSVCRNFNSYYNVYDFNLSNNVFKNILKCSL